MITLFPKNRFWRAVFGRPLKYLIDTCTEILDELREEALAVFFDIFPNSTRQGAEWKLEMGTEEIAAAWGYRGGMTLTAMNDALHAGGFPGLNFHEYASDIETNQGDGVSVTPRDLTSYAGYCMANRVPYVSPAWLCLCGEDEAYCGEEGAYCGEYVEFNQRIEYLELPAEATPWHVIVATPTFASINIPVEDRKKLEELALRVRPLNCRVCFLEINYV